mgnify:CR=1 FL=1
MRRQGSYKQEDYVCKGVTLAVKDYTVGYKNKKIQLRPREFKLMELLLINAGQILPRELLLGTCLGYKTAMLPKIIWMCISVRCG